MTDPTVLYRFFNRTGRLLYVGITEDIGARFVSHSASRPWFREVASIKIERYDERYQAEMAEKMAIREEDPVHNIVRARARKSTPGPMGRPPSDNPRTNAVPIRLSDDELALIRTAAERAGTSVGEWARTKLLAAAKRQR